VAGLLVLVDGILATVWQEPVTAIVAARRQHDLRQEWARLQAQADTPGPARPPASGPVAPPARVLSAPTSDASSPAITPVRRPAGRRPVSAAPAVPRPAVGHAAAQLHIPRLGLTTIVVRGTTGAALQRGPGIYDDLPWPGRGRVAAIAGHRTTWGAPFRHLDRLRRGDGIELRLPGRTLRYRVTGSRIVEPHDRSVLTPSGARATLVLTACDPPGSASRRLAVRSSLIRTIQG
jgi:LPXTG-site transpeptidase (sortase) family protein